MSLIEIIDIGKVYGEGDNRVEVLKHINLTIEAGDFVAIIGQSGSGKSTLMNILGCLDTPATGSYLVDGVDVGTLDANGLARLRGEKFGFIFQRYNLLNSLSARDNVALPAVYAGIPGSERDERAALLLGGLGLSDKLRNRPNELSGGQQQRVSIARALMNGGEIILADEPTGALDSKSGEHVMDTLLQLNAEGHTIILVTHDRHIASFARRVIEIKDGEIIADEETKTGRLRLPAPLRQGHDAPAPSSAPSSLSEVGSNEADKMDVTALPLSPSDVSTLAADSLMPSGHPAASASRSEDDAKRGGPGGITPPGKSWGGASHSFSFHRAQFMEAFTMSVQAILAHKLRSMLTMLGIIIGIASVVTVVALGQGSQEKILANISSMGTNTIDIMPGTGFGDRRAGRIRTLTVADSNALAEQSYIASSTPISTRSGSITWRNIDVTARLNGVGEQYFDVKGLKLAAGRGLTKDDVAGGEAVAIIDDNTFNKLFQGQQAQDAVGQVLLFNRQPLMIIGVAEKQNAMLGPQDMLNVWTPYTTVMNRITGARYISSITVKIRDDVSPAVAEKDLTRFLTARHSKQDFFTVNTDSIREAVESSTATMTILISGIALISLVVGGIGVMNIMLVSVTERTREIGVRMAIGARQYDVLQQFLIEAVLLCVIGGTLGVLVSLGIDVLFSLLVKDFSLSYSAGSVVLALTCSSLIGVIFGYVPARNASRLNPVEALARE